MDKDRNKQLLRLEKDKIRAKEKNNYKEIAEICNYKGELYSKISYFSEALQEHNEELKYCRKNGDVLGEAIAYRKIGECHAMMEQFEDALVNALRYRKLVEENENNLEIQRAWTTIGRIYFLQYSSEKNATALKCAKAATKQSLLAAEKLRS
ncbi:tonsoku-like protein, partial [Leptotrombidium deliense]